MAEKKNYDSDFCGSLPLNHINVIQDYGFLLILRTDDLQVIQFSDNLPELIAMQAKDLVGKTLADLVSSEQLQKITSRLGDLVQVKAPFVIELLGHRMEILIHQKDTYVILEMEKKINTDRVFTEAFEEVKLATARLERPAKPLMK